MHVRQRCAVAALRPSNHRVAPYDALGPKITVFALAVVALAITASLLLLAGCNAAVAPDNPASNTNSPSSSPSPAPDQSSDTSGGHDSDLLPAQIDDTANQPPVANAGPDLHATAGQLVTLDGTATQDPDGDALTYAWQQTAGSPQVALEGADTATATFTAPDVANDVELRFRLTARDAQTNGTDVTTVTVAPAKVVLPPVAIEASTTNGFVPLSVTFSATVDGNSPPEAVFEWSFDDGSTVQAAEVNHVFTIVGLHEVALCLILPEDETVEPSCATLLVEATQAPPPPGGGGGPPPPPDDCTSDVDSDGVADCDDGCPNDPAKSDPGVCGCGVADTDSDSDGVADCNDQCPNDAGKLEPGVCGCGVADADTNGNGVIDCEETPPTERTADLPDSWLVLYNANSLASVTWVSWYRNQWGIPAENALGLDVDPTAERILRNDFVDDIYLPVIDYLDANPQVADRVMGILVGHRVPGCSYVDADNPAQNGGGGWSITSALQYLDPAAGAYVKWPQNPRYFVPGAGYDESRLTKATLAPGHYLTARIDAPTLTDAQALTTRARAITTGQTPLTDSDWLYYDYDDPGSVGGDQWDVLRATVEQLVTAGPPEVYPWRAFESDGDNEEPTPDCALRFSYYRLTGWQNADWGGTPTGPRILGYALNSFGATTVRSTTDLGGRYVPNVLVNGGFAAAVGATAEPYVNTAPVPATMVWCLADGRTVAEAFYHANRFTHWMWELDGDPLMRVPTWFGP